MDSQRAYDGRAAVTRARSRAVPRLQRAHAGAVRAIGHGPLSRALRSVRRLAACRNKRQGLRLDALSARADYPFPQRKLAPRPLAAENHVLLFEVADSRWLNADR